AHRSSPHLVTRGRGDLKQKRSPPRAGCAGLDLPTHYTTHRSATFGGQSTKFRKSPGGSREKSSRFSTINRGICLAQMGRGVRYSGRTTSMKVPAVVLVACAATVTAAPS